MVKVLNMTVIIRKLSFPDISVFICKLFWILLLILRMYRQKVLRAL